MQFLRQGTVAVINFGPFLDKADGVTLETGAGIITSIDHATTGIMLSKNGGTLAVREQGANFVASVYDAHGFYKVSLSAVDTGTLGRLLVVHSEPATYLEVWPEFMVVSQATWDAMFGTSLAGSIADAVWDETVSPAVHNAAGVAGDRLLKSGYIVKDEGLCAGGSAQTITLGASASAVPNIYCQDLVSIVYGTGIGQSRLIVGYTAGKVAIIDRPWDIDPIAADSYYQITAFTGLMFATTGTAVSATPSTITLAASALGVANSYVGCAIYISSGIGMGQTRLITGYTPGRIATVSPDWDTTPDFTSAYKVLPIGRAIVESMAANAISAAALSIAAIAKIQAGLATLGTGPVAKDYAVTDAITGLPIADVLVWITTDIGGVNVICSGRTNALGIVTFRPDVPVGTTLYVWRHKTGENFIDPDTEVL